MPLIGLERERDHERHDEHGDEHLEQREAVLRRARLIAVASLHRAIGRLRESAAFGCCSCCRSAASGGAVTSSTNGSTLVGVGVGRIDAHLDQAQRRRAVGRGARRGARRRAGPSEERRGRLLARVVRGQVERVRRHRDVPAQVLRRAPRTRPRSRRPRSRRRCASSVLELARALLGELRRARLEPRAADVRRGSSSPTRAAARRRGSRSGAPPAPRSA